MSKHTPGPWKFNGLSQSGGTHFNVVGTLLGKKWKIARCPFTIYEGFEPASIDMSTEDKEEAEANARLIAAAPEMYDMLTEALICLNREDQAALGINELLTRINTPT